MKQIVTYIIAAVAAFSGWGLWLYNAGQASGTRAVIAAKDAEITRLNTRIDSLAKKPTNITTTTTNVASGKGEVSTTNKLKSRK
jgi:hypothetical protein